MARLPEAEIARTAGRLGGLVLAGTILCGLGGMGLVGMSLVGPGPGRWLTNLAGLVVLIGVGGLLVVRGAVSRELSPMSAVK